MIERAVQIAKEGKRFLVACHRRPDADSLGSALGLIAMLRATGKEATLFMSESIPESLQFLVENEKGVGSFDEGVRFDATWIMDIAAKKLLPPNLPGPKVTGPLIVVDHHHAHDDVGDIVVRDTGAAATGEVVMNLMEAVGVTELPKGAATPLYAAIVSDTGGFRYASTRPDTLRLGARLIENGADPWRVAYQLFERWEPARLKLLAEIISTLQMAFDGRAAIMRVTRKMLADCGANDDMVEGMVNYARRVEGAEIGALLWEWPVLEDGSNHLETKISLRSSGKADVSSIAQALNGGGHRAAAATQLDITIDEADERLRAELAKYFG
ncbi:MAG: bifunctional oligoribonuclease/PAP phosphatase NrnA [Myxococcales bacterium]|nr:bifunctional oligoribonuclease/PAP phosphatase NrnA [Myxococcales bacterium]MDH3844249.1 bifunctional oligoribonuclease/PAP phosphatase NrnA [Myxococcales bacterium]